MNDDAETERVLARALELLEQDETERPERDADMARRRSEWRLPEPEPPGPRTAKQGRMDERERHQLANFIRCTVERQVAAALRRERAALAEGVGKVIAAERAQFRKINDALIARIETVEHRAASSERREFFESLAERVSAIEKRAAAPDSDASILDLRAERLRRAGE